jgi:hypothetical protein
MSIINGIDYGDLIFSKRIELDTKAYEKYYSQCEKPPLSYNTWYGSESHKKFILPLLRKLKLDKIKKADI